MFRTSVGGVARMRARGHTFLAREGTRLADGDIDSIGFASPRLGWLRLRRREPKTALPTEHPLPYSPLVWLVTGGRGPGLAGSDPNAPRGMALGREWSEDFEALRLTDDVPVVRSPARWYWDLDLETSRRWGVALAEGWPIFRYDRRRSASPAALGRPWGAGRSVASELRFVLSAPFGSLTLPGAVGGRAARALDRAIEKQWRLDRDRDEPRRWIGQPTRRPYRRHGRRDPFVDPFLGGSQHDPGPWIHWPDERWQMLIEEIEIGALFREHDSHVVEIRVGSQNFSLRTGDELWDGDVLAIDPREGIEFRQSVYDPLALRPFRRLVRRPPPGTPGWAPETRRTQPSTADPFVPLDGVTSEPPRPSILTNRYCGALFHRDAAELDAVLDRAGARFERYRWERSLVDGIVEDVTARQFRRAVEQAAADDLAQLLGGELSRLATLGDGVDPSLVEVSSLLADLQVVAGRPKAAADLYREAEALSPAYAPLCGRLHDGKLYGVEGFGSPRSAGRRWLEPTQWLQVWDPDTGESLGRHVLPAPPEGFSVVDGALRIALFGGGEIHPATDSRPAADRVVWEIGRRRYPIDAGTALARNFVRGGGPVFEVGPRLDTRQAVTLEELESDLRAAMARDPHVPWHRFFLGQALWAQGLRAEAEDLWRPLWIEVARDLPFYEQLWMAAFHEGFGQPSWADRGYDVALTTRTRLPQPIVPRLPQERYELGTWLDGALRGRPERRFLWWQRLYEIQGRTWGDFARAALWAEELDRRGRAAEARATRRTVEQAVEEPWDPLAHAAWIDYGLYGVLAALAALWARWVIAIGRWLRRCRVSGSASHGSGSYDPGPRVVRPSGLVAPAPLRLGRDVLALGLLATLGILLAVLALTSLTVTLEIPTERVAEDSDDVVRALEPSNSGVGTVWRALWSGGVYPSPSGSSPLWLLTLDGSGWSRSQALAVGVGGVALALVLLALPAGWLATRPAGWRFARWGPGVAAARQGHDFGAALRVGAFALAVAPLLWLAVAKSTGVPTPGWVSGNLAMAMGDVLLDRSLLPLVEESGGAGDSGAWDGARDREFLTILRAFPGFDGFAGLVVGALVLALTPGVRPRPGEIEGRVATCTGQGRPRSSLSRKYD